MTTSTRATAAGTASYRDRFAPTFPPEAYRRLGDLSLAALSSGSYLGEDDEETDRAYEESIALALRSGLNGIDTAINYRCMRSERSIGRVLANLFASGEIDRSQVVISTKGGYVPFDGHPPADFERYLDERFVSRGLAARHEFVVRQHCLAPAYIQDLIDTSLTNLGLAAVDVYYLHNPETQLRQLSRDAFLRRLAAAVETLERNVEQGKIGVYGTATWDGFRVSTSERMHLSLEEIVATAREVGGPHHHFRVAQLPFSAAMPEALIKPTQPLAGRTVPFFTAARELGVAVMTSAPLVQGQLARRIPRKVRQHFPFSDSDAEAALRFALSAPWVTSVLCGMRWAEHVRENLRALLCPTEDLSALLGVRP